MTTLFPKNDAEKVRLARWTVIVRPWCPDCDPYSKHVLMALDGAPIDDWRRVILDPPEAAA